jgi:hypothetical protein
LRQSRPQPQPPIEKRSAPAPAPSFEKQPTPASSPVGELITERLNNPITVKPITVKPVTVKFDENAAPAASPSKQEENQTAIKLAAKELKKNPELKRDELYDRLFGSANKRPLSLKEKVWATHWTRSRFRQKVWKKAREGAGLDACAPKGRRPDR